MFSYFFKILQLLSKEITVLNNLNYKLTIVICVDGVCIVKAYI